MLPASTEPRSTSNSYLKAMDELLPFLLSFPRKPSASERQTVEQNDEHMRTFVAKLRKVAARNLLQPVSSEQTILDMLDPALNTISYSIVLIAHIKKLEEFPGNYNNEQLAMATSVWFRILNFMSAADLIQVRYVGDETREIVAFLEPLAHNLGKAGAAVAPIARFIRRLDPGGSILSSQHILLCQIALRTGALEGASQVLEHDIFFLPLATSQHEHKYLCSPHLSSRQIITVESGLTKPLSTANVQEYFLLGASILMGLHKWQKAAGFLENVISYPTKMASVSGAMVEAYKRWLLVQLVIDGKIPKLPKMVNSKVSDSLQAMAPPYEAIGTLFEKGTSLRLSAEVAAGADVWARDGNAGLIRKMLDSYQKRRIMSMASVFTTVPMSYIIKTTGDGEGCHATDETAVVALITGMIQRSELQATITTDSSGQSFLSFDKTQPNEDELVANEIQDAATRVSQLMEDVQAINRSMAMEKEYVKWVHKQKKSNGGSTGLEDTTWPVGPDDEDLMAN